MATSTTLQEHAATTRAAATARVLVVEDDPALRAFIARVLRDAGHEVSVAANLEEGLVKLAPSDLDLLVTDKNLPDGSGLELVEAGAKRGIAAVLLTGYGTLESAIEALRRGATDFLVKPVEPQLLVERVRAALESRPVSPYVGGQRQVVAELQAELKRARTRARGFEALLESRSRELERSENARRGIDQRRKEFVSTLSHDLRSSLASVMNACEVMLRTGASESSRRELLEVVHDETRRAIRLLGDVSEMERLESGTGPWNIGPVVLSDAIDRAILDHHVPASRKEVSFRTVYDPEVGLVLADADKLVRALHALVDNAVQYSPRGGVVTVSARPARTKDPMLIPDRTRDYIEVVVEDTGPGMSEATQARAFEPFFQGPPAAAPEGVRGSGLGLSIARRIVERLGGAAWIVSEPGAGSSIGLSLPSVG